MVLKTLPRPTCAKNSIWTGLTAFTIPLASSPRSFASVTARRQSQNNTNDSSDEAHPSDFSNASLRIQRTLPHLGHKYWGFTIYRCTYASDDAWALFMARLYCSVRESLEYEGTETLLESLDLPVHEDRAVLDGASKDVVRKRFREWVASSAAEAERMGKDAQPVLIGGIGSTPRFACCIQVDEEALQSVIRGSGDEDDDSPDASAMTWNDGYVNIIKANGALPSDAEAVERRRGGAETEDSADEGEEPVEGCRMHDVGWMRVRVGSVMPGLYAMLMSGAWEENYVRPPGIAGG